MDRKTQGTICTSFFTFLFILLSVVITNAQPIGVSGTISSNTTWNHTWGGVEFTGDVTVQAGVTLTVANKTDINLLTHRLIVNGKLVVAGSSSNTTEITQQPGSEIYFESTDISELTYCNFSDVNHKVTLVNSTVNFNEVSKGGFSYRNFSLTNSTINFQGGNFILDDTYCSFSESTMNVEDANIYIDRFTLPAQSTLNLTSTPSTNVIVRDVTPGSPNLLTVNGTLNTSSTATNPINPVIFEIETTNDHGVDIVNAEDCQIDYCKIRNGGNPPSYAFRVINTKVDFSNTTIYYQSAGFLTAIDAQLTIANANIVSTLSHSDSALIKAKNGSLSVTDSEISADHLLLGSNTNGLYLDNVTANFTNTNFSHLGSFTTNESNLNYNGGAVYANGGTTSFSNCNFTECTAYQGGAISLNNTSGTISDCLFEQCLAATSTKFLDDYYCNGGAAYLFMSDYQILRTNFNNNGAIKHGNAICAIQGSSVLLEDNTFSGNNFIIPVSEPNYDLLGDKNLGTVYLSGTSTVDIKNNTFNTNSTNKGGGIYIASIDNFNIEKSTFNGNSSNQSGGAVYLEESKGSLLFNEFKTNSANMYGGGIAAYNSELLVGNSLFKSNTSIQTGGGIYLNNSGTATNYSNSILNNVFYGNDIGYFKSGSALLSQGANLQISNSIFWGNTTTGIEGNVSQVEIFIGNQMPLVNNNIIENNELNVNLNVDLSGSVYANSSDNPLFTNPATSDFHVAPTSPAINAGYEDISKISWTKDYENEVRIFNGTRIDIGIYESKATINPSDSLALVAIYNATGGTNWTDNSGWLTTKVSGWFGITLDGGNVTAINLANNNLAGSFPEEIDQLLSLETLDVSGNSITSMPASITNASKLRTIDFSNNLLSSMPDITTNTFFQLEKLDVKGNQMTFEDLLPNYTFANFLYAPQQEIAQTPSTVNIATGESATLSMDNLISAPTEITYSWYQDGVHLQTNSSNILAISNASYNDAGEYICKAIHTKLPLLSLERSPISVSIIPPPANNQDSIALVALYNECGGANWTYKQGWLTDEVKDWYGVYMVDGRVVGLYLSSNNLSGSLPSSLNNLEMLETLDLSYNQLSGNLTLDFSTLQKLTDLNLSNNQITGSIPASIPVGFPLYNINLSNNELSGEIPSNIGNANKIIYLDLSSNSLTGAIPSSIASLTELFSLKLSNNALSGSVNIDFSSFPNLQHIDLCKNKLNGNYPTGLTSSNLTIINIGSNLFTGTLPTDWTSLKKLNTLDLSNNLFSGEIPTGISQLPEIEYLHLDHNDLKGEIPKEIGQLVKLKYLCLDHNEFSGNIPLELSDLNKLVELNLGFNKLSGTIPLIFDNLSVLRKLYLNNNSLEGEIPSQISLLGNLTTLSLYANNLTGSIPPEIGMLSYLEVLELNKNKLSGELPAELGNLSALKTLSLRTNQLSGRIPASFNQLEQLQNWYIYDNQIVGIPDLTNLKNLEAFQIFNNWIQFADIAQNINVCDDFQYTPQRDSLIEVSTSLAQSLTIGKTIAGNNNAYFWTKDLVELGNSTASHTIPFILSEDQGKYHLGVSNPSVPNLTRNYIYNIVVPNGDFPTNTSDSLALVDLYNACNGANWEVKTNWLSGKLKTWHGIELSQGRVVSIDLSHNNLIGSIPESINNLDKLGQLLLSNNQLNGTWPFDFNKLPVLQLFDISNNSLSGSIPDNFPATNQIRNFYISNNDFEGDIPTTWGNLDKVSVIDFSSNSLSSTLPRELTKCVSLTKFNAANNKLTGSVNADLSTLMKLQELDLSKNSFSGVFPISLITSGIPLVEIDLSDNAFTGDLPNGISQLKELQTLKLSQNSFSGSIPTEFGDLPELKYLGLNNNKLSGSIPDNIGSLLNLEYLKLERNELSGSIPETLSSLDLLVELNLNFNKLTGEIPEIFAQMTNLLTLSLSNNKLTGSIPAQLGELKHLKQLCLYANLLTGNVPPELSELSFLEVLEINKNELSGELPEELGKLRSLKTLSVRSNKFTGKIPDSFAQLTQLEKWYMYDNQFTGIPNLKGLVNLEAFQIFNNWIQFGDIEPNLNICDDFQYTPQRDSIIDVTISLAESLSIGQTVTGTGNVYSWTKDLQELKNDKPTYAIPFILTEHQGEYHMSVTNSSVPDLTLNYIYKVQVPSGDFPIEKTDSLALVDLYNSSNGQNWEINTNWLTGKLNSWHGVYLSQGRVVAIDLSYNNLKGEVPESINNLEKLGQLNLSNNLLEGKWPFDISKLSILQGLNISTNAFSGEIPDNFPETNEMRTFDISSNNFEGSLPETWGYFTKVTKCDISSNSFLGSLPEELTNCKSIVEFDASNNKLNGSIETDLSSFVNLQKLNISKNSFSGGFPQSLIKTQIPIVELDLSDNNFSGELPLEISQLKTLETLKLNQNGFSGSIPAEIGDITKLEYLGLNNNKLSGSIPSNIGSLANLKYLRLDRNELTGSIPEELAYLDLLVELNLNFNKLSGNIPEIFDLMSSLQILSLSNNKLTGTIPAQIGYLKHLIKLSLYANQLSGTIPPELGELSFLEVLEVNKNALSGELPEELGYLRSLKTLSIRSNKFTGRVPDSFSQLTQLEKWYMYDNEFTGIPVLDKLVNLEALQIFNNWIEFGDIAPNLNVCDDFQYSPQKVFTDIISTPLGTPIQIGKEISGEKNIYKWYKDSKLQTFDDPVYNFNASEGIYQLQVTNYSVSDLTITRTYEIVTDPTLPIITQPQPYCLGDLNVHLENTDSIESYWYWDSSLTNLIEVEQPANHIDVDIEADQDTIYVVNRVGSKISSKAIVPIKKRPTITINGSTFEATEEPDAEYKWFLDGILVGTGSSINATEDGAYQVTLSLDGCSSSSKALYWYGGKVTGINDNFRLKDFSIYPNPTSKHINLEWENSFIGEIEVKIICFDGKLLSTQRLSKATKLFKHIVDIEHLQYGKYFCSFKINDTIVTKQFIKL